MFTSPRNTVTPRLGSILTFGTALATSVSIVALSAQSAIAQSTTLETISVEGSGGMLETVPDGGNGSATSGGGGGPSGA